MSEIRSVVFSVAGRHDLEGVARSFVARIAVHCARHRLQLVGLADCVVRRGGRSERHRLEVALASDPDRRPTPKVSIARIVTAEALSRLMREVEAR